MASDEYSITFTDKCLIGMQEIEKIEHIHEALEASYAALRKNPYAFGVVPPLADLRFVKTNLYLRDDFTVPPLMIIFTIIEGDKEVRILEIYKRRGFGDLELEEE